MFSHWRVDVPIAADVLMELIEIFFRHPAYQLGEEDAIGDELLWTHSIQKLADDTIIIECGPGKVLAGLIKKINPNLKVISLDSETGFSEVEAL